MWGVFKAPVAMLVVALLSMGTVRVGCQDRVIINGIAEMLCVDDIASNEFIYLDLNERFGMASFTNNTEASEAAYQAYASGNAGLANNTTSSLETRSLTKFFSYCGQAVAGVCANGHVIAWTGSISSFAQAVTAIVTAH